MATPMEQSAKVLDSFKQFWSRQEKKNKIMYIVGLVAAVLIAVIIAVAVNRKDYVVLFEGLETAEAAEMVAIIEDAGYEYSLNGGTITVPKGTENALTMTLAQQGYPKSTLTYNLYTENIGMFSTESEKREYQRMALESRLSAIIGSLDNVEDATVTLSIPEQKNTVIAAYIDDPGASVVVTLKDGTSLSTKQIKGITHIVQQSVAGLEEENISIVDSFGILQIADESDIDVIAQETRKLQFKTNLENQIKNKIIELLAPAYNEDGLSVAVNMVLNFDAKVYEDVKYTPSTEDERGMLQHAQSKNATGYAVADGGVVGVEVNADDTYPTGTTGNDGSWSESAVDNTYLVNTYKEQVEKEGYTIDNLSVSVIIYTDYLPEATKQELVSVVGNAASINPLFIQDVVTVTSLPKFGDMVEDVETPTYIFGLTLNQLVILGAILLALLIILIVILVVVSNKTKQKRKKFERELLAANGGNSDEPLVQDFFSFEEPGAERIDIPSLLDTEGEESKEVVIRREIATFARQRPEIVAQLLRSWMLEDDNVKKNKKSKKEGKSSE